MAQGKRTTFVGYLRQTGSDKKGISTPTTLLCSLPIEWNPLVATATSNILPAGAIPLGIQITQTDVTTPVGATVDIGSESQGAIFGDPIAITVGSTGWQVTGQQIGTALTEETQIYIRQSVAATNGTLVRGIFYYHMTDDGRF